MTRPCWTKAPCLPSASGLIHIIILCIYCRCTLFFFLVFWGVIAVGWCDLYALVKKRLQSFDSFAKIYIHTSETDWCDWKNFQVNLCRLTEISSQSSGGRTDPRYFHILFIYLQDFLAVQQLCNFSWCGSEGKKTAKVRSWFLKVNEKQLATEPNFLN